LFGTVTLPVAVHRELVAPGSGNPGAVEVQTLAWLKTRAVVDQQRVQQLLQEHDNLHRAEADAIVLALEINADLLIVDEGIGRRVATDLHLPITGVLGILLRAKERGLLEAVKPVLDQLRTQAGFFVAPSLYRLILQQAGEASGHA